MPKILKKFFYSIIKTLSNERGEVGGTDEPKTFDAAYVHELREECKANRLQVADLTARLGTLQAETTKKSTMYDIGIEIAKAGLNLSPESIYLEGKSAAEAMKIFSEKNPSLFKKKKVIMAGDIEVDADLISKMDKPYSEIKKDPAARNFITRLYQKLLNADRQKDRRLSIRTE